MGYLNRALDYLYSIINANPQIINATFEDLTDFLAPVWDRYVEDMLCSKNITNHFHNSQNRDLFALNQVSAALPTYHSKML